MQAACLLADKLFAFQEGLCSMALRMSQWQAVLCA
jgi:hypothetical protein